ncbi:MULTISPECIES: hypothetical protein [Bradyrhizobium]|jgi:hypothetical protein|uniref:hypothetical protein n=1 Tax=Bradyrhizobium TaxID=374 RepID=UPI0011AE2288|nr:MULTISPECIES: hypothetical protein [Bradyrhizobium]
MTFGIPQSPGIDPIEPRTYTRLQFNIGGTCRSSGSRMRPPVRYANAALQSEKGHMRTNGNRLRSSRRAKLTRRTKAGDSIGRQASEIAKRLAFLRMIEAVIATHQSSPPNDAAQPQQRRPRQPAALPHRATAPAQSRLRKRAR